MKEFITASYFLVIGSAHIEISKCTTYKTLREAFIQANYYLANLCLQKIKFYKTIIFMKLRNVFLFSVAFTCATALAQQQQDNKVPTKVFLESLFHSDKSFTEITREADEHFTKKYPDLSFAELCVGEHRDGAFVKYQRWKSFWKNHLNDDGTLGDFTAYKKEQLKAAATVDCNDSDVSVDWKNINYTSNMGYQIDQGRTSAIAFHPTDPSTYYVGAAWGGLWKTTDNGATHTIVNDNLPLAAISSIIIDPLNPDHMAIGLSDIIWYGSSGIGVYVSTDGGESFTETAISWELSDNNRIYYMDQDPNNSDHIMVATTVGLYKTEDFFETVAVVQNGDMRHVAYSKTLADCVYAGGDAGEFYKSTDGGDNFELVNDFGGGQVRIAVPMVDESAHVAITHANAIKVSSDHGETFQAYDLPESNMVIAFAPMSDTELHIGNFEAYRSTNFGESFAATTQWLGEDNLPFIHVDQRNIFINPLQEDKIYLCNDGGVFRYDVNDQTYENLSRDLMITQYYDIAVSQTDDLVVAGGSQDNGNIFRSATGTWESYAPTGDGMGQEIDPSFGGVRYWSYQFGGLNRWEGGSNTAIAPPGEGGNGAWETPFKLDPNNSNRLFVAYNDVYASDDNGDNWYTIGNTVSLSNDLEQLAISPSNSDRLYASRGNRLYVKDLDSDNWNQVNTPSSQTITDLEVDFLDENTIYICVGGYSDGNKVFKSEDAGENWINISENLPNLPILSLELHYNLAGGVFIGSYGAVYYIDDSSSQWKKYGCLPFTSINDIEVQYQTGKIFIGTHGRGMYEALDAFNGTSVENEVLTNHYSLSLYPNPVKGLLRITSEELKLSDTKLHISDVLGRSKEAIYEVNANNEILVDCSNLSKGIYFVTLINSNKERFVAKFIVEE